MVSKPKVYLETSFISYMVGKDATTYFEYMEMEG